MRSVAPEARPAGCFPRLALLLVFVLIGSVIAFAVLPPFRTAVRTVALVPELLDLPVRPLSALIPAPALTTTSYGSPPDRLDIYVPQGATDSDPRPAVVLALGVHPPPLEDPEVVRLATSIARLGVVVAVPDSTELRLTRVLPTEPAHLADAVLVTAARPEVDPQRVGLAGTSAGASIALIAAADPRISADLRFVSAFGGYADAETLLVDVATRTTLAEDQVRSWSPDAGIRRDVLELLIAAVEPEAARAPLRDLIAPFVSADDPPLGSDPQVAARLEGDARAGYMLFTARDRAAARAAIDAATPSLRGHLAGISPINHLDGIRAPVYLLHGDADVAIPVEHAVLLAEGLAGDRLGRFTRFGRFEHERPGEGGLGLEDLPDVWSLTLHLNDIVATATE
jgi:dienelactone hydrolase